MRYSIWLDLSQATPIQESGPPKMNTSRRTSPFSRDTAFSFTWPANTFATTLVGTDGQTYEAIHIDFGVRCVKIDRHESPVVLVDVGEGRKVLLSGINPLHVGNWHAFAGALLAASKDSPAIPCEAGVTFPRVEFEAADAGESIRPRQPAGIFSDDPEVIGEFLRAQICMSSRGCSVAEATAMDFSLETTSVPAAPIEFNELVLFALVDTVGGVETIVMSFLFGPDSWVRA